MLPPSRSCMRFNGSRISFSRPGPLSPSPACGRMPCRAELRARPTRCGAPRQGLRVGPVAVSATRPMTPLIRTAEAEPRARSATTGLGDAPPIHGPHGVQGAMVRAPLGWIVPTGKGPAWQAKLRQGRAAPQPQCLFAIHRFPCVLCGLRVLARGPRSALSMRHFRG